MPDSSKPDCHSEVLSKLRLFAGFKDEELDTLISLSDFETFDAGDEIVTEGEIGICMYVILTGRVEVVVKARADQHEPIQLAALGEGDFFGELGLVDDGPRSASVIAREPTEVLRITRMVLGVMAGVQPAGAIHLLAAIGRSLVNRLRAGNQKYLDLILLGYKESTPPA